MIFSGGTFGEFAFGGGEFESPDPTGFPVFLDDPGAEREWLLEITHAAGTHYFSALGYTSHPTDTPANTFYDGRIVAANGDRRLTNDISVGGLTAVDAKVTLANGDGELDQLTIDTPIDGRRVALYVGRPEDARETFGLVFSGEVRRATAGLDQLALEFSDVSSRIAAPVQTNLYAGTGGLEGGDDLKDQPRPRGLGRCWNISPPLVDSTKLIYQVNDGAIDDVPEVRDRGIVLTKGADYPDQATLESTAPSAGQFRVWEGGGYFRLGSTPAGTVTCDIKGDASGAGYVETTSDIIRRLLSLTALTSSDIDPTSLEDLEADAPAPVGIWIGVESRNVDSAIEELLIGASAFGGFSRFGPFKVGRIVAPGSKPVALALTEENIIDIARVPLPESLEPIVWQVAVAWKRNYTPQNDFASAVTAAVRNFAVLPFRQRVVSDAAIRDIHLLAKKLGPVPGLYALSADALTESQRLHDLWSTPPLLLLVTTRAPGLAADLGSEVTITHPRLDLSAGEPGLVLNQSFAIDSDRVELLTLVVP